MATATLVDVELDETVRHADAPRRRWVALAAAVLVVAVAVTASALRADQDATERAGVELLPALDQALEPIWSAPGDAVVADLAGVVVTADPQTVWGVDAATGEVLWARTGEVCQPLWGDRLACVAAGARYTGVLTVTTSVHAVAADTGATIASVAVDGPLLEMDVHGQDLIVASVDYEGALRLVRWDPGRDREEWTFASRAGFMAPSVFYGGWRYEAHGEVLRVLGDELIAVSAQTGEQLPVAPPPPHQLALAEGTVFWDDDGAGPARGYLADGAGEVRFQFAGVPFEPVASDGSAPSVLLLAQPGRLVALDVANGNRLWAIPMGSWRPLLRAAGVVVAVGEGEAVAVDLLEGVVLWREALATEAVGPISDGHLVVLPLADRLGAIELGSGLPTWELDLAVTELSTAGEVILAATAERVIALEVPPRPEVTSLGP